MCNSNFTHYTCNFTEGFTGINCEIGKACEDNPHSCPHRGCGDKNEECAIVNLTHYTCNFTEGFAGINCEIGKICKDRGYGNEDVRTGM